MEKTVNQYLQTVTMSAPEHYEAKIYFPLNAGFFRGHFPQKPIVPGVMLVETVRQAVSRALAREVLINSIKQIKFKDLIGPDEEIDIALTITPDGNLYKTAATLTSSGELKAKMVLSLGETT